MRKVIDNIQLGLNCINNDNFEVVCEEYSTNQLVFYVCDKKLNKKIANRIFSVKETKKLKRVIDSCSDENSIAIILESKVLKKMGVSYLCVNTIKKVNEALESIFDSEIKPVATISVDNKVGVSLTDKRLREVILKKSYLDKAESNVFLEEVLNLNNNSNYCKPVVLNLLKPLGFDIPVNVTKKTKNIEDKVKILRKDVELYLDKYNGLNKVADDINTHANKICLTGFKFNVDIDIDIGCSNVIDLTYEDMSKNGSKKLYSIKGVRARSVINTFLDADKSENKCEASVIENIFKFNNIRYKKSKIIDSIAKLEELLSSVANDMSSVKTRVLRFEVDSFGDIHVLVYNINGLALKKRFVLDEVCSRALNILMDEDMNIEKTEANICKLMAFFALRSNELNSYLKCSKNKKFCDVELELDERVENISIKDVAIKLTIIKDDRLEVEVFDSRFGVVTKNSSTLNKVESECLLAMFKLYFNNVSFEKFLRKYILKPSGYNFIVENMDYELKSYVDKILKKAGTIVFKTQKNNQLSIYRFNENNQKYTLIYSSLKKKDKNEILDKLKTKDESGLTLYLFELLSRLLVKKSELDLLDNRVGVNENVLKSARNILKTHINEIQMLYIEPINSAVNSYDSDYFYTVWEKYISSDKSIDVIGDLKSIKKCKTIKQKRDVLEITLETLTASVVFNIDASIEDLSLKIEDKFIEKLKKTKDVVESVSDKIMYLSQVEDYISKTVESFVEKIEYEKEYEYVRTVFEYRDYFNKKIDEVIGVDLIHKKIEVGSNIFSFDFTNDDDFKEGVKDMEKYIESEIEKIYFVVKKKLENIINKRKNIMSEQYLLDIAGLIDELPKKGITTYISILHGDKGSKISQNDYDKSLFYGKMSGLNKKYIENVFRAYVDKGYFKETAYEASFGRYYGFSLSKEVKNLMLESEDFDIKVESVEKIETLKTLFDKLKSCESIIASERFLSNYKENHKEVDKEELLALIDFIKNNRPVYRDYEKRLIYLIHSIVPSKYSEIFLLNSVSTSGVVQKTFKNIYKLFN